MSNKSNKIDYGLIELKQNFPYDIIVQDIFSHSWSTLIQELYALNLMCFDRGSMSVNLIHKWTINLSPDQVFA